MNLSEKKDFIINTAYFAICIIITYIVFKFTSEYLFPFLIGIVVAYLVQNPAKQVSLKYGIKKENLAAIFSVVFFVVIIAIIALLVWLFCIQVAEIIGYFSNNTHMMSLFPENLSGRINDMLVKNNATIRETIKNLIESTVKGITVRLGDFISDILASIFKRIPGFFISSIITVVATCYISKDYERLKKFLKGIISDKKIRTVTEIKNILTDCVLKFMIGYFWIFIITFAELFVGFLILGVKKFFITALMVAFLDLLPIIGTGTVLLPWSVFSFVNGDFSKGIGLVILYVTIVVIRNFYEPRIIGNRMEINPIFMLVFIFVGLKLGGILGMILLPIVSTVAFTYLKQKYVDN